MEKLNNEKNAREQFFKRAVAEAVGKLKNKSAEGGVTIDNIKTISDLKYILKELTFFFK